MHTEILREQVGVFAAVLGTIFPELILRLGELPTSDALPTEQAHLRLYEAVSTKGLLLIFDDLQRADKASFDLLCYLIWYQPTARLLALGAFREGEAQPALDHAIDELNRLRALSKIALVPLAQPEYGRTWQSVCGRLRSIRKLPNY